MYTKTTKILLLSGILSCALTSCVTKDASAPRNEILPNTSAPDRSKQSSRENFQSCSTDWCSVKASFYGGSDDFNGKKTASGERFDPRQLTAAHRSLPFGTKIRVRNPDNGREITAEINDRGPHSKGRELDLSLQAARELGMVKDGVADVQYMIQK